MGLIAVTGAEPLMLCPGDFPRGVMCIPMSWFLSALPKCLICLGASFFKFLLISWLCQLLSKLEDVNQTPGLGASTMVSSPLTCPFARPCVDCCEHH